MLHAEKVILQGTLFIFSFGQNVIETGREVQLARPPSGTLDLRQLA